jgi:hypothetical protein
VEGKDTLKKLSLSDPIYIDLSRSQLEQKFHNRRNNQSLLVRCLLCNEVVEIAMKNAKCKYDCPARRENNNDPNTSCISCAGAAIECIEHLNFHVALVDYNLKNQTILQTMESLKQGQCTVCQTPLQQHQMTLHTFKSHSSNHCIQSLASGLPLHQFYGSVFHTNFQTLIAKCMPTKEMTLLALYD